MNQFWCGGESIKMYGWKFRPLAAFIHQMDVDDDDNLLPFIIVHESRAEEPLRSIIDENVSGKKKRE
jgi:hypothetical protein